MSAIKKESSIGKFFGVITKGQTYLNMAFLFLSFPLGITYFVFAVVIMSVGLALSFTITFVGIPLLIGFGFAWWGIAWLERNIAQPLLKIKIPYVPTNFTRDKNIWQKFTRHLRQPYTWKSLGYLFIKFPMGIFSFVVLVLFLAVSFGFIASPVLYYLTDIGLIEGGFCIDDEICFITSYFHTIILATFGVLLLFVSLHIFNGLAGAYGLLAKMMLSKEKNY